MEHYHSANAAFVEEDFLGAIELYSAAIKEMPEHAESLLNRGTAYLKQKSLYSALEDLNTCLDLRPDWATAQYRRGIIYFELEEFESAKMSFEAITKADLTKNAARAKEVARYVRTCDVELSSVVPPPKAAPAPAAIATTTAIEQAPLPAHVPIKYQYYQSDKTLSISVLVKNLSADDVSISFAPEQLKCVVRYSDNKHPNKSGEDVVINKELFGTIDVTKSKFSVLKTKVGGTIIYTHDIPGKITRRFFKVLSYKWYNWCE